MRRHHLSHLSHFAAGIPLQPLYPQSCSIFLSSIPLTLPLSEYNPIITHSRDWLQYPYWYFMTSQVTAPEAQAALSCSTAYLDDDDRIHVFLLCDDSDEYEDAFLDVVQKYDPSVQDIEYVVVPKSLGTSEHQGFFDMKKRQPEPTSINLKPPIHQASTHSISSCASQKVRPSQILALRNFSTG